MAQPISDTASALQGDSSAASSVLKSMKQLYESKDTKQQDAVIDSTYAEKAEFEDGIAHVFGRTSIKSQFHALAKCFGPVEFICSESKTEDAPAGGKKVTLTGKQKYGFGKRTIELNAITTVDMDSAGMITRHKDVWQGSWINLGLLKRPFGSTTSMLYRMIRL
jgi:hypothetical protein